MTNLGFGKNILPSSATGLEQALAGVDSDRITKIPAEIIRDIWDPVKCPSELLAYLAWAFGVQYWNDKWSDTTKRTWIASQLLYKSERGTEAALRMAVDFAGRDVSRWGYKVPKITTQPQRVFSGPSLTKAEREAWLASLPQVRFWRVREAGLATISKAFYGGSGSLRQISYHFCFISGHLPIPNIRGASPLFGAPELGFEAQTSLINSAPLLGAPVLVPEGPCSLFNGPPLFGAPALVAKGPWPLTNESPEIGAPEFVEVKHSLWNSAPMLGAPVLTELTNSLTNSAPVLGAPAFVEKSNSMQNSSPVLGAPLLTVS